MRVSPISTPQFVQKQRVNHSITNQNTNISKDFNTKPLSFGICSDGKTPIAVLLKIKPAMTKAEFLSLKETISVAVKKVEEAKAFATKFIKEHKELRGEDMEQAQLILRTKDGKVVDFFVKDGAFTMETSAEKGSQTNQIRGKIDEQKGITFQHISLLEKKPEGRTEEIWNLRNDYSIYNKERFHGIKGSSTPEKITHFLSLDNTINYSRKTNDGLVESFAFDAQSGELIKSKTSTTF